jgi:Tfp pilus assembly protein PilP
MNLQHKIMIAMLSIACGLSSSAALAEGKKISRDPFAPFSYEAESGIATDLPRGTAKKDPFANIDPTTRYPLSTYRVIGVINAPKKSVAAIKARDRHDYYLTVGQKLGKEGAVITKISNDGVTLDAKGREIFIIVRNKFEIEDDDAI